MPPLPPPFFSMWQCTTRRASGEPVGAPVTNLFFFPPTIGPTLEGAPLEDVLFMRDEMANLAWAIERTIEGATEAPVDLTKATPPVDAAPPGSNGPASPPRYLLASTVPDNWIPLLPVQLDDHGTLVSRLKPGAVLQPDGTRIRHVARSEVLKALAGSLLFDEEVPREGVRITRRRRMSTRAGWVDIALDSGTGSGGGSGEGSAGRIALRQPPRRYAIAMIRLPRASSRACQPPS